MSIQDVAYKIRAASRGRLMRTAAPIGIIAAVTGPFLLLTIGGREANNLPWYVWTVMPLLLLAVVSVGFFRFRRKSHEAEDISISPKPARKS